MRRPDERHAVRRIVDGVVCHDDCASLGHSRQSRQAVRQPATFPCRDNGLPVFGRVDVHFRHLRPDLTVVGQLDSTPSAHPTGNAARGNGWKTLVETAAVRRLSVVRPFLRRPEGNDVALPEPLTPTDLHVHDTPTKRGHAYNATGAASNFDEPEFTRCWEAADLGFGGDERKLHR